MVEHHLAMVGVAGSNPVFRLYAPIAQLDRVSDYESEGCRFDSCWMHYREVAQFGRAPGLGPGGRRFESCLPDCSLIRRKLQMAV